MTKEEIRAKGWHVFGKRCYDLHNILYEYNGVRESKLWVRCIREMYKKEQIAYANDDLKSSDSHKVGNGPDLLSLQ